MSTEIRHKKFQKAADTEIFPMGKLAGLLQLTEEELLYAHLAEAYNDVRLRFCGSGTLTEKEMEIALTTKREDEILLNLGFNGLEIEHKNVESLRRSYDEKTFKLLQGYVANIRKNFINGVGASFLGKNGSGKTSSMALMFRYLVRCFYSPMSQKVNLGMVKKSVDELLQMVLDDDYNRKAWYCEVKVLGIDDMLHYTDTRHNALRFLINERTSKGPGYLTFMTSRLTEEELEKYSDVYSRMGYGFKFWTVADDFRKIKFRIP